MTDFFRSVPFGSVFITHILFNLLFYIHNHPWPAWHGLFLLSLSEIHYIQIQDIKKDSLRISNDIDSAHDAMVYSPEDLGSHINISQTSLTIMHTQMQNS